MVRFILLLLFLGGCAGVSTMPEAPSIPSASVEVSGGSPAVKSDLLKVTKFTGFWDSEITKAGKYIPLMNSVIASDCFEQFMINRSKEAKDKYGLVWDAPTVVNDLRTKQVHIELIMYYKRRSRVAGYTYPGVDKIWLNRKYHAGAALIDEASNLAHETSHKLGYEHDFKATYRRPYSVPYSINAGVESCSM